MMHTKESACQSWLGIILKTKNEEAVIKNNVACCSVITCSLIYVISTEFWLREFTRWWYTWPPSIIWCTWYTSRCMPFNIWSRATAERKKCKIKIFYDSSTLSLKFHVGRVATETLKMHIRRRFRLSRNSIRYKCSCVRCILLYHWKRKGAKSYLTKMYLFMWNYVKFDFNERKLISLESIISYY